MKLNKGSLEIGRYRWNFNVSPYAHEKSYLIPRSPFVDYYLREFLETYGLMG